MSRVAKAPVNIPAGVEVKLDGQLLTVKGKNGELSRKIHESVESKTRITDNLRSLHVKVLLKQMLIGYCTCIVNAMVIGVTEGFTKKLYWWV